MGTTVRCGGYNGEGKEEEVRELAGERDPTLPLFRKKTAINCSIFRRRKQ